MNDAHPQDSLFPDPLGMRLRVAREQAGLSPELVAAQLRLPLAIVEAMEREDWARLGAPVYVRSYLGGYLKLLGLPPSLLEMVRAPAEQPKLVTLAPRSRMRHTVDASLRNIVYLVMTAVLVVPVYFVARHYQNADRVQDLTLDPVDADAAQVAGVVPVGSPPAAADADATAATSAPVDSPAVVVDPAPSAGAPPAASPDPVMASMAPFAKPATSGGLVLTFNGESWVDIVAADGTRIERGLVPAGAERRFDAGEVAHVTLGNADGVVVVHGGRDVDLAPFRSANVARFAVSSDGAPTPAAN